jgi:hypothetical protein
MRCHQNSPQSPQQFVGTSDNPLKNRKSFRRRAAKVQPTVAAIWDEVNPADSFRNDFISVRFHVKDSADQAFLAIGTYLFLYTLPDGRNCAIGQTIGQMD